jgi:hypothetical protein
VSADDLKLAEPFLGALADAATDLGGVRIVTDVHETYRMSDTGDFAYARDRRIDLTIQDGKIARYEMRVVG